MDDLARELGDAPALAAELAALPEGQRAALAAAIRDARARQHAELARAIEDALEHVPRLLRGALRRVLFP